MRIEAITTCVGKSALDMLIFSYVLNCGIFDNFIVVTTPEDKDTQRFCNDLGISLAVTNAYYKYNFKFNKGAAINEGLKELKFFDWIIHLDSDIILREDYREILEKELDDIECFYGSRRIIVPKKKDFFDILEGKREESDYISYPGIGYGYIQIWNMQSSIIKSGAKYPEIYEKGDSDWKWRNLWGDCINSDTEYTGKLKRISANVLHLGLPDISGADNFWKE